MKKMENFLRRALSMLLSLCMLLGNVNLSLAETASVVSESTGILSEVFDIPFNNNTETIHAQVEMTYLGTSNYVWNGSAMETLDKNYAWYWLDTTLTKDDTGYLKSFELELNSSTSLNGTVQCSMYYGADQSSVDMSNNINHQNGNQADAQIENNTKVKLKVNVNRSDFSMPQGCYRLLIGLPLSDTTVANMLKSGSTITNTLTSLKVNGVAYDGEISTAHTISFKPVVTKTATKVTQSNGWGGSTTYIRWEVHYTNNIKLYNTIYTDTVSAGTFVPYKTGNTVNKIGNENAIQAYEGSDAINGHEEFSNNNQTITFNVTGINEDGNHNDLRHKYTTDLTLVYFTQMAWGEDANTVVSNYTLTPNGIAGTEISGKMSLSGNVKDVTVQFMRAENGGEPALIPNQIADTGIWLLMANSDASLYDQNTVEALTSAGQDGVYTAQMQYLAPYTKLQLSTAIKPSEFIGDGDIVVLDVDGDGVTNYKDRFVVDINDSGSEAVVTLTNYVQVPVSVSLKRSDASGETDALLESGNAPQLYAVMLDAQGNAVSSVVPLNGANANGILSYNGEVYPNASAADGEVALLTLKKNQQYDANFSTDRYNVHQEGGVAGLNLDGQDGITAKELFVVNMEEDAETGAVHATLLNTVEAETVTLKLESYDEENNSYSAVTPYNSNNPNLYLAYIDANGTAYSQITNVTNAGNGVYTAVIERFVGAESELNILVRKKQDENPGNYYTADNADKVDRYYASKLIDNTVPIEINGPNQYSQTSLSMDEFFRMTVTEDQNGTLVHLVNDRESALQGLVDAYNGGKLEVNESTGSFADYDGGKYYNELSPIGIAGSFHLVAFDTANLKAHTNGNVLANVLNAYNNFGTNNYPFELTYVVDYRTVHTTSASSPDHILALGAGNHLAVSENGGSLNVGVNGVRISAPKNVIIDKDEEHPFIDLDAVEAEVVALSATLASNDVNVGISEEFGSNIKYLRLISNSGAGYYNMSAQTLMSIGSDLRLAFSDQNKGSIVINVDCNGFSEINMPERALVNINGKDQGTSEVTTFENGKVIWNFIGAEGKTINVKQTTGMIIAPGATVNLKANVNGTVIADVINVEAESHRTDFTGTTTPTTGAFGATKQINGKTPSSDEKFWFVLEQKNADDTWTEIQRVQNNGSEIVFSDITYDTVGTYTYRFRELGEGAPEGYGTSGEVYYMEVTVYASSTLGNTALGKEYKRWKDGQDQSVSCDFIFHNTKDTADLLLVKKDSRNDTKYLEGAKFEVYKDGALVATYTTNDQGRVYLSGLEDGTYVLKEVEAPYGYILPENNEWTFTKDGDNYTLNGTYENAALNGTELSVDNEHIDTTTVSGHKTWNDNNNEHHNRPENITVVLLANGEPAKDDEGKDIALTVTPNANGEWNYDFGELPLYDENGEEYEYTVQEIAVPGYITSINGYNIHNDEETTYIYGQKTWSGDAEWAYLTRPASVTIRVWKNDVEYQTLTATADSNWSYSLYNLPKYENRQPVVYTVTEDAVPGYTTSIDGFNVTNTLQTTSLSGEKSWSDQDDKYGLRPDAINVTLKKNVNGTITDVKTISVSANDGWKWNFDKLPTKELVNGQYVDVTYSVAEIPVPGYTGQWNGNKLENTLKTIDINGSKEWVDAENVYSTRPETVTINLLQNGSKIDSVTTDAGKNWEWSFEDLPEVDDQGVAYTYTVTEEPVKGYTPSYDQENYVVTNTLETTELSGVKGWNDEDDKYGLRPDYVVISIMNGTQTVTSVTAYASEDWQWSISGLPKYDKVTGLPITYTVDEVPSTGYAAEIDGYNIVNNLETIDLSGTKTWVDNEELKDLSRPASITIKAMNGTTEVKYTTSTAADNWQWEITDLPKYNADGSEAVYTIVEAPVAGYTTDEIAQDETTGEYSIINRLEDTEVTVEKQWLSETSDSVRPETIEVQLYADQTAIGDPVVLPNTDAENPWKHVWTNLPVKNADGSDIDYTVDEITGAEGYVKVVDAHATEENWFIIKNIFVDDASAVLEANKTLTGPNGLKEGQFTFELYDEEDTLIDTKTNDASGHVSFDAITYDQVGEHFYTIKEKNDAKPGYTYDSNEYSAKVVVTQDDATKQLSTAVSYSVNGETYTETVPAFRNTYTLESIEITIPVEKVLNGTEGKEMNLAKIAGKFSFELKDAQGNVLQTATNAADGTVSFEAIKFESAGEYIYTITESGKVAGIVNDIYATKTVTINVTDNGEGKLVANTTVTEDGKNVTETITFTNTYETIDLSGKKVWAGDEAYKGYIRPKSITVKVTNNGVTVRTLPVEVGDNGDWSWTITELPKYDDNNQLINYTVTEEKVNGYQEPVVVMGEDGTYTITNTLETVDKGGSKVWVDDSNDAYGTRPESITVIAKDASGVEVDTTTATGENWAWSFTGLPKYDKNGVEIEYTFEEEAVTGYETSYSTDHTQITNTLKTVDIEATKKWEDDGNKEGFRPKEIQLTLTKQVGDAAAVTVETVTVTGDETADSWTYKWEKLPKYENGEEITYAITEEKIANYEEPDINGLTVTNRRDVEYIDISVTKSWQDNDNAQGFRPDSVNVQLVKVTAAATETTAEQVQEIGAKVQLSESNSWTYKWEKQPKYENGQEIVYKVVEDTVANYTTTYSGNVVDGFVVTNTHTDTFVDLNGTKVWDDNGNQDGKRPDSIQITLKANGVKAEIAGVTNPQTVEGNKTAESWNWSFKNLPEFKDGQKVTYTVEEVLVKDGEALSWAKEYTTSYTADTLTITNTHTPETVDINGTKTWADDSNRDGVRPESITITLYANGEQVEGLENPKTVTGDMTAATWDWSFEDLPKYADGSEITYTVTEEAVGGYTTAIDGFTVTNAYETEKINISVLKVWNDGGDQDGLRSTSITVQLNANSSAVGEPVTLNSANGWTYKWEDLPKFENGEEITYTVVESGVHEDYESDIASTTDAEGNISFTITNTHTPETMQIPVTKVWDDANNQDGKQPESITFYLWKTVESAENEAVVEDEGAEGEETAEQPFRSITRTATEGWNYTFTDLPVYENGQKITYTVTEEVSTEYVSEVTGSMETGFTVTNTHKPETTEIIATKIWDDAENQDGKRPTSITLHLLADGTKVEGQSKILPGEDATWTVTWTELPKYANGTEIVYTVKEEMDATAIAAGYTSSYFEDDLTVTNSYETKKTSITVEKVWVDAGNQDGIRPASVTVHLLADGKDTGKSETLSAANNWKAKWTELDMYENGAIINYTVSEDAVADYEVAITGSATSGYVVTNTHVPETTEVSGSKTWDDADDQDGKRPESITINLLANGEKVDSKVITPDENGNWPGWEFRDLPKKADGKDISYTVSEEQVDGYTTTYDGMNVTNSYTPGKTSITVNKFWDDADDQDGIRPTSITYILKADGEQVDSKTVTEENNWSWTFTNLDEYADGKKITYTVEEEAVEGYTTTVDDGYTVKNTHVPETTEIKVTKAWDDNNNQDGKRTAIKVQLYADGTAYGDAVELNEGNNWTYTWKDLDKNNDGVEIKYTVDEVNVPAGYDKSISGNAEEGFIITNTHTPETLEIKGTKTWNDDSDRDDKRPEKITITLTKKVGDVTTTETKEVTGTGNDWSWSFGELPVYEGGVKVEYSISESGVPEGYTSVITGTDAEGFTITNTHEPELIDISGIKEWDDNYDQDGKRPGSVVINLLADGEKIKSTFASESTGWAWSFEDLPKFKTGFVGDEIEYTITEDAVKEYTTNITGSVADGFVVKNTHTPETTKVSGVKTWNDKNDQDGKRPESITIRLLANGKEVESKNVTEENNWSWSWEDLPVYQNGVLQTYTVTEDPVTDYTTTRDGYNFTNSTETEETSITVLKVWDDEDDQDGIRPESISVQLKANGVDKGDAVELNEGNDWTYTWEKLDKKANGAVIAYTVDEVSLPEGYTSEITGEGTTSITITNTHEVEKTSISGTKTWVDNNDQDGIRPDAVTIQIMVGDKVVAETDAIDNGTNIWSWIVENLDKKANGVDIVYTVNEVLPAGYEKNIEGTAVTNTHTPETVSVKGSKVWVDNDDQDGFRPDDITVTLYADGVQKESKPVTGSGNTWSWSFDDLPKYRDGGVEIVYTVEESNVPEEYTSAKATVNGETVFTNTHEIEKIDINGIKAWSDNNDQDGIRPESVTINLKVGTEIVNTTTATKDGGWVWSFEGLDKYANGEEIVYVVEEEPVEGYTSAQSEGENGELIITNTHQPEKTSLSGSKAWSDANNQDGIRPDSVTIKLLADGEETEKTTTATEANGWIWSFTDLDKFADGEEIVYTAKEVVPEGYTASYNGTTITNTHVPELIDIEGSKTWNDNNDQDGLQPEYITIRLYADGEEIKHVNVTASDNWSWTFENLPKFKAGEEGIEIIYTITEDVVEGYETTINGYNVTNTHTPELINLSGSKTWNDADNQDGKRPTEISITLLADGEVVRGPIAVTAANGWTWLFTSLPKYEGGREIAYTVAENAVEDYTTTVDGLNVTNSYTPGKTFLNGVKVWDDANDQDGNRPESITINLMKQVGDDDVVATGKSVTLNETTGWNWSFADLDQYEGGKLVTYSVTEDEVSGYTTDIVTSEGGFVTITNSYEPETIDLSGKKTWDDADNQDNKRPTSITVRLLADGIEVANATVSAADGWDWEFNDLPKYRNGGVEIKYTLTEDVVDKYTTTIDGMNVTNSYETEKVDVNVEKVWDDNNDQDGKRPASITVQLKADGENKGEAVTLNEANSWSYEWTELPKYRNMGTEIEYSVVETVVPDGYIVDYSKAVNEDGSISLTITNSHETELTSISGSKVWSDADNQDGIRPASIVINLLANGTKVDSTTVYPDVNDNWSWSFENLDKYADGDEIAYTFTEEAVTGYETTYSDNTTVVTNTHKPETVNVEGVKDWDDMNNQDGKRPESIVINLLADGEIEQTIEVKPDTNGDWSWKFEGLPKFKAGTEIVYSITEEAVAGYTTTYSGYNVKNSYTPGKVSVSGSKTWNDANDQDGKRPESIEIQLLADGQVVQTKTVTAGTNNWSWSFTNLDEYKDGQKIVYTINEVVTAEMVADRYVATVNGFNVTNDYTTETLDIEGTKTWADADDQDGFRPDSITIRLWADGKNIKTETIEPDANGNWPGWKFEDLPKYRDHGTEIVYAITEDAVENYTTSVEGYSVTNTHTPETVDVEGTKTWADKDDQDGKRPESITINLLADGQIIDTITVNEEDGWSWSFTELPKRKDGVEIVYTITEEKVEGYATEISGYSVINTHTPETVDVEGAKTWTDANNQDGKRPAYITIHLLADGVEIDSKTITAENGWKWSWTGLDKYKNGSEIVYTIVEDKVPGYDTEITGYDVENTHEPETVEVAGTKTWNDANDQDGKRPASITINLLANGEQIDTVTIQPDAEGNWPGWKFEDLPKYAAGKEITYSITENTVAEYTTEVTGYDVLNSYTPGLTSVSVSKTWADDGDRDGYRPASITFNLLADNVEVDEVVLVPDANGVWPTYTFDQLPIYAVGQVGHKIIYTVTEDPVTEYETTFTGSAADGYYFTNTHEIETVDVTGTKTWTDEGNQDGKRPVSITINLLADGKAIDTATVTEADGWSWSFTNLPKYRDQGIEIVYTITEDEVAEYTTVITGYDVENIHVPETTEVAGTKTWTDANDQDGKRPESITINLLADGNVVKTVTVTEAEGWSWSFTDLPVYENGNEITYSITEEKVEGYDTVITGYNVENTHVPETVEVAGTKTWTDEGNQDGKRPAVIVINLLADGEVIKTVNVTAQEGWSWKFTDLPKYEAGKEITYTITENEVAEYTTTISGYDVENSYEPETVEVAGTKTWTDANDQDGKRPEYITINLLADGEKIDSKTVFAKDNWSWSFTELPKYKVGAQGQLVTYTITEDAVEGYTTTISDFDVENSYVPETVEVAGSKTWTDAENQDGKRPEYITINLLADGEKIDSKTVFAKDNWSWSFTELPKYKVGAQGQLVTYTITEEPVDGYETVITGYDVENTYEPELITIEGGKTWDDAENQDGVRPASIVIKLMDGSTVVEAVTVTETEGWKWSFTDLPKYRPGAVGDLIEYYVVEELDEAAAGEYSVTVDGYNVINTHKPATVEITGSKTWDDLDNKYLKRPDSVTIRLLADGEEIDRKVVTEEDNWSWTFTNLPKFKVGAVGQEIKYTITEDVVTGYITTVDEYNVLNTLNLVEFIKTDEQTGKRLPGAVFALYEGKLGEYDESKPVETWVSTKDTKVLAGLKVGQTYTIVETAAPSGYAMMAPFQFTVELTDIPGTYRAFSASNCHVYRFRKLDSATNGLVHGAQMAVTDANGKVIESWWSNGDNDGWHEIADSRLVSGKTYKLVELISPWGYELAEPITFSISPVDGMLIINGSKSMGADLVMYDEPWPEVTPTPEPTETSFTVTKRWEDKDNVLGLRPNSITVHLYRKLRTEAEYPSMPFMTVNIPNNGKNVWNFTFENLPRRSADGVLYEYSIREELVEGYVVSYLNNGKTIVNTIPEEDFPPTPTPTLPYVTPTPSPMPRIPTGVQFIDGEWVYVDEYGIPLGGIPLTGDDTNFVLWGMAIGLPLLVAALAAVEIRRRKKLLAVAEQDEEVEDTEA